MIRLSLCLLVLFVSAAADDVFRYGRFEQIFTSEKEHVNPLTVEVLVEFTGPGAVREEVLAFWDDGHTWKVRFSPERTGAWRFQTFCSDAADSGLHEQSGKFMVSEYAGSNELYLRGPPRVSPNRRFFVHADGRPWFFLSDTAWNGALLSTREEWNRYLADRAAKRFTATQFVMTQWRAGRQDEKGQLAFTGVDEMRVNPSFFQRMDERFDAVNEHGLVAVPVVLWALTSKDKESPGVSLPTDQAILLARYIVSRYGAHHAIWFLGGDGEYRGEHAERWKTIARAVFPENRSRSPVSLHPRGRQSPWELYRDEYWVDYLLYQSGHGSDADKWRWNATQGPALDWKMDPPRPVIDGEPNYEAHISYHLKHRITDYDVRRAAYYSLLAAPVAGVSYGAHGIWSWVRKPEVPLDHPRTGVAEPWFECLDYPGAHHMRVMRDVFDSVQWWRLRPDRFLLAEDPEDPEFKTYMMPARSEDGSFALIYLPANPSVKLNLSGFGRTVAAQWIDPRTGERTQAGKGEPAPEVELRTPGEGDWLLLLRE